MNEGDSVQRVVDSVTLLFAAVIVIFGIGIVTGLVFPRRLFVGNAMRTILGLVMMGYGSVRIIMIGRRLRESKRRKSLTKNA